MSKIEKPFAPACERNQEVILQVLKMNLRTDDKNILEIGSGTGQHAVYMGKHLSGITWQTADVKDNHDGINMWLNEADLENVLPPIDYQIGHSQWPAVVADVVFSANVLHIISEELVERFIKDLGDNLQKGNRVMFYGPFKYNGQFTSESNADFQVWLKEIDSRRGIRDFEKVNELLGQQNITLIEDVTMPANNQLLIFEKA